MVEVKQLYTNCLSEAAYYIESEGEVAIIDPMRGSVDEYLALAQKNNATIKYIFETHFHADFISGHIELQERTDAPIIFGPDAKPRFKSVIAKDNQQFKLGGATISVLHTPGHTIESTCYLLTDGVGKDICVFTGDTLFVGSVGRPDLSSGFMSSDELAELLYHSIQNKLKPLADDVIVYPAHGPGSACGAGIGKETQSTIGKEKATNPAFTQGNVISFAHEVTKDLSAAPSYFAINASMNAKGYKPMEEVLSNGLKALDIAIFEQLTKDSNYVIVDTRSANVFTLGFVPGSISVGLEGRFAEWAAKVVPFDKTILIVTDEGKEEEAVVRLSRVGLDTFGGYLKGGFTAWQMAGKTVDMIIDIEPDELIMDMKFDDLLKLVDVRSENEYHDGHIRGAENIPLQTMNDPLQIARLSDDENIYVHCAGGYRSVIAASLIKRQGLTNVRNILGGYSQIIQVPESKVVLPKANEVS